MVYLVDWTEFLRGNFYAVSNVDKELDFLN